MVLDHSVSQLSESSHSRTQTKEERKCVYQQRNVRMGPSGILRKIGQPVTLPPKPQKMKI